MWNSTKRLSFAFLLALSVPGGAANAQPVRLDGTFTASEPCKANRKKDSDNPGNVRLQPSRAYEVLARNNTPGTHYRIRVPDAPDPQARWVPMTCGVFAANVARPTEAAGQGGSSRVAGLPPDGIEAVLAASWQPGFCATPGGRDKPECRSQTPDRFDATHFSIHGLWPDDLDDKAIFPCYCDRGAPSSCAGNQPDETEISISEAVMDDLTVAMPGVQSGLHLHEWSKHGTCHEDGKSGDDAGSTPDEYFSEAMALLEQLNGTPVRKLFAEHLGETLSRAQIEAAFDQAFGRRAGERVLVRCPEVDGAHVITELWITLKGDISASADLGELIQAAPPAERASDQRSCEGGRVTEVPVR